MKKSIRIFETESGKQPFAEWLDAIRKMDKKTYLRIQDRILRIAEFGILGDCKPVGQGVFELRFAFGAGYRVYFGEEGETIILLLYGGDKRTQKQDIKKAQEYWRQYNG